MVRRVAAADDAGLEAFVVAAYEAHHAEVFAFLAGSTGNRALAEVLLRETFRGLTGQSRSQLAPADVRGLLYRIAAGLVVARSAKPARTIAPPPEHRGLLTERSSDMERALEGLSVDARVALLLSAEGFTGQEIAAAIVRPASDARGLLRLARKRVRIRRELFAAEGR